MPRLRLAFARLPFLAVRLGAFRCFDLFPIFQDCGGVFGFGVAEDVRVAADHLRVDGFDDVRDGERAGFFGEDRMEGDLQQQITEFGGEFARFG